MLTARGEEVERYRRIDLGRPVHAFQQTAECGLTSTGHVRRSHIDSDRIPLTAPYSPVTPKQPVGRTIRATQNRRNQWNGGRLFALVLIGGLIVRLVRLAMNSPLWGDEAMIVHSLLDRSYAELLQPLDYIQIAPLGFLWGELTCFLWFGSAEWVWRLLPTVAGCVSLLCFARFAFRVLPRHAAYLAGAIAASSLYLVRHTVEAKPYILDFAIALMLLQLGWRIHERPGQLRRWEIFGFLAVASVWCSFPSAFVAGGILLSLLPALRVNRLGRLPFFRGLNRLWRSCCTNLSKETERGYRNRNRIRISWFVCGTALSLSFAVMYFLFGRVQVQTANEAGYWQFAMWEVAFPPWHRPDRLVWWLIREHAGSMLAHPFGGKNFASLGTFVLVICGAIALSRRNPRLLWMLLAPAGVGFFAACLQKYPYGGTARTMLYLAPTICLLAGLGAWAVIVRVCKAPRRRVAHASVLILCLGLIGGKTVLEVARPYKEYGDWLVRDTVQRWAAESAQNDVWVIANAATTPDRTDRGIYGGITVAVFDHYTQVHAAQRALHPRRIIDCPKDANRVMLLVHESLDWPLTIKVGENYRDRFLQQAQLLEDEAIALSDRETLRKLVFTTHLE